MGLLLGILAPIAGLLVFYFWKASSTPLGYFLEFLLQNKTLLTAAISFSLFANAIVFTWAVNTHKDKTAKGVFLVTLLITIPLIIYKLMM